jgi:hypothetical protein
MTKTRGPWARFSVLLYSDPKIVGVSWQAQMLYMRAIMWSCAVLSDGSVPAGALHGLAQYIDFPEKAADELVEAGLWRVTRYGWRFPPQTWTRWQETSEEIAERRASNAERLRRFRARHQDKDGDQ